MISTDTFRTITLAFPDTVELPHFHLVSFRVNKRIFATMDEKKKIAVLMFSPIEQSVFCVFDRTIIYPVPGGWGAKGATIFELDKMKKTMMKDALSVVYREIASKSSKKNKTK